MSLTYKEVQDRLKNGLTVYDRVGDNGWRNVSRTSYDVWQPWTAEVTPVEVKTEAQPDPLPLPADPKRAYGATKPSVGLIPPVAKAHCAMALEDGAQKYGPFNWRGTHVEAMTYLHAAYRHLDAFLDGEDNTRDTEISNLGAVMACCAILLDAQACGTLIDNRPSKGKAGELHDQLREWKRRKAKEKAA